MADDTATEGVMKGLVMVSSHHAYPNNEATDEKADSSADGTQSESREAGKEEAKADGSDHSKTDAPEPHKSADGSVEDETDEEVVGPEKSERQFGPEMTALRDHVLPLPQANVQHPAEYGY